MADEYILFTLQIYNLKGEGGWIYNCLVEVVLLIFRRMRWRQNQGSSNDAHVAELPTVALHQKS